MAASLLRAPSPGCYGTASSTAARRPPRRAKTSRAASALTAAMSEADQKVGPAGAPRGGHQSRRDDRHIGECLVAGGQKRRAWSGCRMVAIAGEQDRRS